MAQKNWMSSRQTRFTAYAALYTVIILAVLGLGNFLANRYNKSFDATANKRFSLSDQTEKVVKNLKAPATITYWDKTGSFAQARDLLDRYDNLSTKLNVAYIDPDKKPQQAKVAGVKNFGAIFVEANGRKEEAKSMTEEEVTGALIRALKGGQRTICFVAGHGEKSIDEAKPTGYSGLKETLERNNYVTRTVRFGERADAPAAPTRTDITKTETPQAPAGKVEIPGDCTAVVVAGPRFDLSQPEVDALKAHVENGGRAMFLLDPPLKIGEAIAENAALVQVIEGWGVSVNKDLTVDLSGVGQLFGLSEVVPLVTNWESHPIVREMKDASAAFPYARTLEVKTGKATVEKLFSTSKNSIATGKLDSPELMVDPNKDKRGPLTIGAAGTIKTGKENSEGRFVIIGSSGFAGNNILRFNGNRDLFLNAMNWLSSDEDLISIRPKDPEDRRLNLTRSQMNGIFWASVVGFPVMILLAGVSVWWRRR